MSKAATVDDLTTIRDRAAKALASYAAVGPPSQREMNLALRDDVLALIDLALEIRRCQRQDSTAEQMRTVYTGALFLGCRDAAEVIRRWIERD